MTSSTAYRATARPAIESVLCQGRAAGSGRQMITRARAARPIHHEARVGNAALVLQFLELAVPGLENPLEAPGRMPVVHRALEQLGQVRAAPEVALELLGPALGATDGEELEEDEVPGHERHDDKQQHDELNDQARARDHR